MNDITTLDELHKTLNDHESLIIFKHSTQCPISAAAYERVLQYEKDHDLHVYRVLVIESRQVSNALADTFGVTHQSPQILIIRDGVVTAHTSHRDITAQWLDEHR